MKRGEKRGVECENYHGKGDTKAECCGGNDSESEKDGRNPIIAIIAAQGSTEIQCE